MAEELEPLGCAGRLVKHFVDGGLGNARGTIVSERIGDGDCAVVTHDADELGLNREGAVTVEPVEDIDVGRLDLRTAVGDLVGDFDAGDGAESEVGLDETLDVGLGVVTEGEVGDENAALEDAATGDGLVGGEGDADLGGERRSRCQRRGRCQRH